MRTVRRHAKIVKVLNYMPDSCVFCTILPGFIIQEILVLFSTFVAFQCNPDPGKGIFWLRDIQLPQFRLLGILQTDGNGKVVFPAFAALYRVSAARFCRFPLPIISHSCTVKNKDFPAAFFAAGSQRYLFILG